MQENTQTVTKTTAAPKPQTVKRKIGKTTYELSLHFSQTSTERMSDKRHHLGGVRQNAPARHPQAGQRRKAHEG